MARRVELRGIGNALNGSVVVTTILQDTGYRSAKIICYQ